MEKRLSLLMSIYGLSIMSVIIENEYISLVLLFVAILNAIIYFKEYFKHN